MKKIYRIALFLTVAFFVSCDEELDINTDPNSPEQITKGLALASAEASLMTVVGGDFTNLGGFYAQYYTQSPTASQYESIDQYNINTTYGDRPWTELYAGCLNDLKFVLEESDADGDTGTALIATVLRAYTFQMLTDIFGDVPYTEALMGEQNITPNVTPGEEIYADLLLKIDEALAAYEANPVLPDVGAQDVIFIKKAIDAGSDNPEEEAMENWIEFANTLKLRMYIRMAYTPQANPAAVTALLAENNFIDQDVSFDNFGTSLNQRNPYYEVQVVFLGDVNTIASNSLHTFYVENSDPRLEGAYKPNTLGAFVSIPQGSGNELTNTATSYSRPNIEAQTPVYFMTVSERYFLEAEALIRYSGGAGAKGAYDAGVQASFDTYGLTGASDLTGPGGVYEYVDAGTVEGNIRQVIIQKWASLATVNNIEAWIETTRTKYPEIVPEDEVNYVIGNRIPSRISVFTGTTVPSILFYPQDVVNRNPNITQHANLTQKVWWDQK